LTEAPERPPTRPHERPADAGDITRGTCRLLLQLDLAPLLEVPLGNGRRADVLALGRDGGITIVEVKASPRDFRADRKWPDYQAFADRFFFAVAPGFPLDLLPADRGLILADRYEAVILREAPAIPLPPARRRALHLRLARLGGFRLHGLHDPEA
jgi:hypothetical protein